MSKNQTIETGYNQPLLDIWQQKLPDVLKAVCDKKIPYRVLQEVTFSKPENGWIEVRFISKNKEPHLIELSDYDNFVIDSIRAIVSWLELVYNSHDQKQELCLFSDGRYRIDLCYHRGFLIVWDEVDGETIYKIKDRYKFAVETYKALMNCFENLPYNENQNEISDFWNLLGGHANSDDDYKKVYHSGLLTVGDKLMKT